jgi:hypothetical protein
MCRDFNCPKRSDCYRYRATPCYEDQTYGKFKWADDCAFFMQVDSSLVYPPPEKLAKLQVADDRNKKAASN